MTRELALSRRELEEERFAENVAYGVSLSTMLLGVVVLMLPILMPQPVIAAQARVPSLAQGIEPVAGNVGALWLQITPGGKPNQLRLIAENSTGAFEAMLLGLSS